MFTTVKKSYVQAGQGKNAGLFILNKEVQAPGIELRGTLTAINFSFNEGSESENVRPCDVIELCMATQDGENVSFSLPLRNATAAQFVCQAPDINYPFINFSLKSEKTDKGAITSIFVKVRSDENEAAAARNCKRPYTQIKNKKGITEFYATKPAADKNTPRERIGEPILVEQILNELCDLLNIPFTDAR